MAKRVFELAKELEVQSKAIVEKCQAEGLGSIKNHMSAVSAGLEATVREWFASAGQAATAVETAAKVDITKVRAPAKKKAKAKAKAKPKEAPVESEPAETQVAVSEPPPAKVVAPAPPAAEPEPSKPAAPPSELPARKVAAAPAPSEAPPAADEGDGAEQSDAPTDKPESDTTNGQAKPVAPAPMNVPKRPKVVSPKGPKLSDVKRPAQLSGPKVVRVEQAEVIDTPRRRQPQSGPPVPMSRGPRGGAGAGFGPPMPPTEDDSRSRRNKRRGGAGAPAGGGDRGRGGGGGGGRGGGSDRGKWRTQDLLEREERLNRSGGFLRQRRHSQKAREQQGRGGASPAEVGGKVKISEPFTIKDLSAATGVKAADIVKKLFMQGVPATINSGIDTEKAQEIMIDYDIELEVVEAQSAEQQVSAAFEQREMIDERPRRPVVTILGHVDHGKTSLLDKIRNANVASGEAGGITQATSAFLAKVNVSEGSKDICFLDTPGHQAFSEMRARGANMTDIVILVVAADDGVMPQTVESINHAKAAEVPIIVALNKIDVPGAEDNVQKIYGELTEKGLNPTEWGGDTEVVKTSAQTGQGIEDLLETIDLQAQMLELTADFQGAARGTVIESRLDEGRGSVANLLVQEGEMKVGDFIVAGRAFGRVRDITDHTGTKIQVAGPATPIQISGIDELPDAGDHFFITDSLRKAQDAAEQRRERDRDAQLAQPKVTLDSMFAQMAEAKMQELLVVLKADVQGSVDVIKNSIEEIQNEDVKTRVLHAAVGGVTESDVTLAAASGAVIMGFNVIPSGKARRAAEDKGIEIRSYRVIYDIVDDVKKAAEGLLAPEVREEVLGHAEVRKVFKVSKVGAIAGCYVTDGTIERNALIRVTRNDIVIEHDRVLDQLKRFKDDAKEVRSGQECGMKIVGYDDIKEGDILECYRKVEIKRSL